MRRIFINNLNKKISKYIINSEDREFHHIKTVLRARKGDDFEAFNGKGLTAAGKIDYISKTELFFNVTNYTETDRKLSNINVAVAVVKPPSFNIILNSLIQLGINRIYPFISENSYLKKLGSNKLEKWNNILIDAGKQSKNNYLTFINKIYTVEEIVSLNYSIKILFDNRSNRNVYDYEKLISKQDEKLLVIGPEAGFSKAESDKFRNNNFFSIKLETNILRSEIATVATVSILKFINKEL